MVCVVGRMRDLILQLSKSSIYSTKPFDMHNYCLPNSPIVSLFTKTVAGHTGALFPVKRAS
ncbi:TPA: hypothetical protein MIQ99_26870 [Klebsiella pneumoniae]|nr:hypothetical protein [Klebsiella pneumoniae]